MLDLQHGQGRQHPPHRQVCGHGGLVRQQRAVRRQQAQDALLVVSQRRALPGHVQYRQRRRLFRLPHRLRRCGRRLRLRASGYLRQHRADGAQLLGKALLVRAQHVPRLHDQPRAVADQLVAAAAGGGIDGARNGEHVPALLQRGIGSDKRAAFLRRFHHDHRQTQAADDAVAHGKVAAARLRARRVLRQQYAGGGDVLVETAVLRRIDHVRAAAQYRRSEPAGPQRALMGRAVDAFGKARDHQTALPRQLIAQLGGGAGAVGRALPRAHHRHGGLLIEKRHGALAVQQHRRVVHVPQTGGIGRVVHGDDELPVPGAVGQHLFGAGQRFVRQALRLLSGDALHQTQLVRLGIVYVLGRGKMLQQQQLRPIAQRRRRGQPQPVFQRRHPPHLPFSAIGLPQQHRRRHGRVQ